MIAAGQSRILIDVGLPWTDLLARFDACFESPANLKAIVITHTHADHMRSARRLSESYRIPVYASHASFRHAGLKKIALKKPFETTESFRIGDVEFFPTPLSHDCDPTVAFAVEAEGKRFGIATDLGQPTDNVTQTLRGCQAMLLEFNHDRRMLEEGPYPFHLKQRVGGPLGHLSNDQAAVLLRSLLHENLEYLVLGHLSEKNNRPEIALEVAQRVIQGEGMNKTVVHVAAQFKISASISL